MMLVPRRPQQFILLLLFVAKLELFNGTLSMCFIDPSEGHTVVFGHTPVFPLIYITIEHAAGLIYPHSFEVIHITSRWVWWFPVAKGIYSCRQCAAHRHWCFY